MESAVIITIVTMLLFGLVTIVRVKKIKKTAMISNANCLSIKEDDQVKKMTVLKCFKGH